MTSLISNYCKVIMLLLSLTGCGTALANNTNNEIDNYFTSIDNGFILTTLTVPPVPVVNHGQFLALWPGFMSNSVLQPVLSWYGKDHWEISSWNCCSQTPYSSTKYPVNVGDAIFGVIAPKCAVGIKGCTTWKVTTVDLNSGKETVLDNTVFNIKGSKQLSPAFFETQYLTGCTDLPANTNITFSTIAFSARRKS